CEFGGGMTISAETYAATATDALRLIEHGLRLLRSLDEDVYWDLAAASCDCADDLRAGLKTLLSHQGAAAPLFDDAVLDAHRIAVSTLRPRSRGLGASATASALDMTSLARNLLAQRSIGK